MDIFSLSLSLSLGCNSVSDNRVRWCGNGLRPSFGNVFWITWFSLMLKFSWLLWWRILLMGNPLKELRNVLDVSDWFIPKFPLELKLISSPWELSGKPKKNPDPNNYFCNFLSPSLYWGITYQSYLQKKKKVFYIWISFALCVFL